MWPGFCRTAAYYLMLRSAGQGQANRGVVAAGYPQLEVRSLHRVTWLLSTSICGLSCMTIARRQGADVQLYWQQDAQLAICISPRVHTRLTSTDILSCCARTPQAHSLYRVHAERVQCSAQLPTTAGDQL